MTRTETHMGAYFSKRLNVAKTVLGFKSEAQEIATLCAILTRFIVKLGLSFGVNVSKDIVSKIKFLRLSNANKRVYLLGNNDARRLATQVMGSISNRNSSLSSYTR